MTGGFVLPQRYLGKRGLIQSRHEGACTICGGIEIVLLLRSTGTVDPIWCSWCRKEKG